MVRYLAWIANAALFTLCCFLVADTANAIIAALLSPSPATTVAAREPGAAQRRAWQDRLQITERNLFHSTAIAPPVDTSAPAAAPDENLAETKLPLKLWGTIAATDPALSWASVEDTGQGVTSAVRVGDKIQSASVVSIERRRVVLLENGARRSLSLEDDEAPASAVKISQPTRPSARTARRTSARAPANEIRERVQLTVENPADLYSQATIKPKVDIETNVVTGLELSAIQPGSVLAAIGIQEGEVITEINGVPLSEMAGGPHIISALADPDQVKRLVTVDPTGVIHERIIEPPR